MQININIILKGIYSNALRSGKRGIEMILFSYIYIEFEPQIINKNTLSVYM